ncbi:hypothetical protein [Actinomadura macrotermitis]|uniref:Uncharacterized protein n=1 Tax=Actinomadura macrotermitis TaxID=2585200 RepID=A0A7K0BPW9_9ACTN|nr:hypothetical protein [Actinomadura macrotermitis]MQY03215.1 hypothetical protein [Actinomadura macrotermitis]
MSDTLTPRPEPLVVPMRLKALVVNSHTRARPFNVSDLDFGRAAHLTPESWAKLGPLGGAGADAVEEDGVHLHWELPEALRHGEQNPDTGEITFREVPNRWVVIRYSGDDTDTDDQRQATAGWIVHSDAIWTFEKHPPAHYRQDSAPYPWPTVVPGPGREGVGVLQPTGRYRIGRRFALTDDKWRQFKDSQQCQLTAVGPGVSTFSLFQRYCRGVFSLHDRAAELNALPEAAAAEPGTRVNLSYLVVGWYSDPESDPLSACQEEGDLLERLRWQVGAPGAEGSFAPTGDGKPTRSVFYGTVLRVGWKTGEKTDDLKIEETDDDKPASAKVAVAVGDTSAEAVVAMVDAQLRASGGRPAPHQDASEPHAGNDGASAERAALCRMLESLQYGLLDELDQPDGVSRVRRLTRQARFEPVPGGTLWGITTEDPAQQPGPYQSLVDVPDPPPLSDRERELLKNLNKAQEHHDRLSWDLATMQERLYSLWWLEQELDRNATGTPVPQRGRGGRGGRGGWQQGKSPVGDIKATYDRLDKQVQEQQAKVDHSADQVKKCCEELSRELSQSGEATEEDRLPERTVEALAHEPFHRAADPVLVIRGAGLGHLMQDKWAPLPCRRLQDVRDGQQQTESGRSKVRQDDPVMRSFTGLAKRLQLEDLFDALWKEFARLDRDVLSEDAPAPRVYAGNWRQPWTPLFMYWEAKYQNVCRDEHYGGDNEVTLKGRVVLSPQAVLNLASRLRVLADGSHTDRHDAINGSAAGASGTSSALNDLADQLLRQGDSDVLSQALNGFSDQLVGYRTELRRSPPGQVAARLDKNWSKAPSSHISEHVRKDFRPLRGGRFWITALHIVDRFGRILTVIDDDNKHDPPLVRAPAVIPPKTEGSHRTSRLVSLAPRLPQPARLRFDLVDPADDTAVLSTSNSDDDAVSPACGWLLPSHLEGTLLAYTADGSLAGSVGVVDGAVSWLPEPGSPLEELASPSAELRHMAGFLRALTSTGGPLAHQRLDQAARAAGLQRFKALRATINEALVTIDPAVPEQGRPLLRLIGRPLVLVRARLHLEMQGWPTVPPVADQLSSRQEPPHLKRSWPVLLGDDDSLSDGLIGYFTGDCTTSSAQQISTDYAVFHAVHKPAQGADHEYVRQQESSGGPVSIRVGEQRCVTLLADPWAAVHATTPILPAAELALDQRLVAEATQRMEAVFRIRWALGTQQCLNLASGNERSGRTTTFPLPLPVIEQGTWSWSGHDPDSPSPLALLPTDALARLGDAPASLRTGRLRLTGATTSAPAHPASDL